MNFSAVESGPRAIIPENSLQLQAYFFISYVTRWNTFQQIVRVLTVVELRHGSYQLFRFMR